MLKQLWYKIFMLTGMQKGNKKKQLRNHAPAKRELKTTPTQF
jgi:hypothetical protein